MWYFAWILGVGFASSFAILNALWLELDRGQGEEGLSWNKKLAE